jgi:hypothetical protein
VVDDAGALAVLLRSAYLAFQEFSVSGSVVNIDTEVDVISDDTGTLVNRLTVPSTGAVSNIGSSVALSRASMIKARFQTDLPVNGRILRGGVFIGPIASSAIDNTGAITGAARTAVAGAFAGMMDVAGGRLAVWHRPTAANPSGGTSGFVQSVSTMPVPAVLRKRRD